jgi:hypothetical protein
MSDYDLNKISFADLVLKENPVEGYPLSMLTMHMSPQGETMREHDGLEILAFIIHEKALSPFLLQCMDLDMTVSDYPPKATLLEIVEYSDDRVWITEQDGVSVVVAFGDVAQDLFDTYAGGSGP